MAGAEAISTAVGLFLADVTAAVHEVDGGGPPDSATAVANPEVVTEVFDLIVAFIDAIGRYTDEQLAALIAVLGDRLPDQRLAGITPSDLRGSPLIVGKAVWLRAPSPMFDRLATFGPDHRRAWVYYSRAIEVLYAMAALDALTTQSELDAIGVYRAVLVARMRLATTHGLLPIVPPDSAQGTSSQTRPAAPGTPPEPLENVLAELNELVGLEAVKTRVSQLADLLRVQQLRKERGLPTIRTSQHLVFVGNPGTGKTTVARLLARIFRTLGVLERGHLVEVGRNALVAGFVGQTAPLVAKAFDQADGGMLFIDEAYTLARGGENDFGREAVDAIVKLMEDRRERIAVVVAGYPDEMTDFLDANPGLRSRFPTTINFPDYGTDDLITIFDSIGTDNGYHLDDAGRAALRAVLDATPREKGFGNGRLARNLFEAAVSCQASRIVDLSTTPTDDELMTLTAADLTAPARASDVPPPPWSTT